MGLHVFSVLGSTIAYAQTSGLLISDVSRAEGNAGITRFEFIVSLSAVNALDVTVRLDAGDGSATSAGNDYTPVVNQTVTIPAGQVSQTITIDVLADVIAEADESFFVNLSSPSPNAIIIDGRGEGSILNDDPQPQVTLSLSSPVLVEAGGSADVTATLSGLSGEDVTINLGFSGTATAGGVDFNASGNQIVIPAGTSSGTINLQTVDDALDELDETINVSISAVTGNALEAGEQAVVATISDDEPPPDVTLSLTGSPLPEAGGSATVTATLSAVSSLSVTIDLAFGGSATAAVDYNAAVGPIVIGPGSTSGALTLSAIDDAFAEADETIIIDITGVTN